MSENTLLTNKHILIYDKYTTDFEKFEDIKNNFCGIVCGDIDNVDKIINSNYPICSDIIIYLCGDIEKIYKLIINKIDNVDNITNVKPDINKAKLCVNEFTRSMRCVINVIVEFSHNFENYTSMHYNLIDIGKIPINIHNVGVYFKNLFNLNTDYFNLITSEHKFQTLTESNKASNAFRTGIYLTKVDEINNGDGNGEIKFNLLRCSTNLNGPTDNFRDTDNEIINKVNKMAEYFFKEKTDLNHVLAQVYENKIIINSNNKTVEKKAKIKDHSDKTKDMPRNGLIAFCTFYKKNPNNNKIEETALTRLRFRLKSMVTDKNLKNVFDVVLHPNSVFIISLHMNRLYTHEIIPSTLPINKIPVRLGYVIRCSKTTAVFKNNKTYIIDKYNGQFILNELKEPTEYEITELRKLYFKENVTDEIINYGNVYFSMNKGDYMKPYI
jgi:hypothetical protein